MNTGTSTVQQLKKYSTYTTVIENYFATVQFFLYLGPTVIVDILLPYVRTYYVLVPYVRLTA